jgi:hypothetical protein
MKYQKLFDIAFNHAYYNGGQCYDLLIEPANDCTRLLNNYKLIFNNKDRSSVSVYQPVDEKGKGTLQPGDDVSFNFLVFLDTPDFISYTRLPGKQPGEVLLFSNVGVNDQSSVKLLPSTIAKPAVGLSNGRHLFALIRIVYTKPFPGNFVLEFEANEVMWKYYVVMGSNAKKLSVDGSAAAISFREAKAAKTSSDGVYKAIANNFPGATISLYESEIAVPFRQAGRKNIRLINSDKNILIDHLPNPGLKENGIKIINTIN